MDLLERRRMLREAAAGLDALNVWIGDAFQQAEGYEEAGEESLAEEMRSCLTQVWPILNGSLGAILARELHDAMTPSPEILGHPA